MHTFLLITSLVNTLRCVVNNCFKLYRAYAICVAYIQGRNHVFKVGGPISWSRVLLPFYRKK